MSWNAPSRLRNPTQDAPHTNGHVPEEHVNGHSDVKQEQAEEHIDQNGDDRPAKRRRTRDSTPPAADRKPKPVSPPWRKTSADGPTSYTENGRRKSGRINTIPIEMQPPGGKRLTRGAVSATAPKPGKKANSTPAKTPAKTTPGKYAQARKTPTSTSRKPPTLPQRSSTRQIKRRSASPPASQPSRQSARSRRESRLTDASDGYDDYATPSKPSGSGRIIRIGGRTGRAGYIPLVHAGQVPKRPKIGTSFEDFWKRAGDISVEEGGLHASEDGPIYTEAAALQDALMIRRIEMETEPGGALAAGKCSLFAPEAAEEPARQWARQDHLVKATSNFRKLLLGEQQRHRATAKRLAEACRDEWLRRQPKSTEQLEAEARVKWIGRYKLVARAMFGTWENVRAYVNRQRLEQWEVEEQKRVKAALNEAVNLSEQKLQARQAGVDSELVSEDDGFDDLSDDLSEGLSKSDGEGGSDGGDEDELDSDNMSSSEEEDDAEGDTKEDLDAADEGLTQEQLRAKYAHIPDPEPAEEEAEASEAMVDMTTDAAGDTSDESVDMDDDLGSSDVGSEESEDDDESISEDESAGGLLGLFFGKSELKQMKDAPEEGAPHDDAMVDADVAVEDVKAEPSMDEVKQADDVEAAPVADAPIAANSPAINGDLEMPDAVLDAPPAAPSPETVPTNSSQPPTSDTKPSDMASPDSPTEAKEEEEEASADVAAPEAISETVTEQVHPADTLDDSSDPAAAAPKPFDLVPSGSATPRSSSHKTEVPFLLRGTLREYQHDGLDWLAGLYSNSTNGILADEMGLGKTIQTIALLAHLATYHEVWGPHLVIVPTSVMLNWEMEFKKWCPGFKILAYYGTQDERKRKRQGWNNDDVWNVCITSYQLVLQDQQVFKRRRWHYLVLDEAHNIKNFKSQRWQTLLGFNTRARLLLTGTPLQNNLTELWSLLFFLMPAENGVGGFADLQEFQDWFHKPESQILESGRDQMDDEARAIITKLHKVLRPYLLRRLKADVEKQMPAKYEHVEFCRLSKRQRELYDGFLARSDTRETLAGGNYLSIINCLMQLRKVCNHPDLFVDRPIMTSFRMQKSAAAEYTYTERKVRSLLEFAPMSTVNLAFLNLVPTQHEHLSSVDADRVAQLSSHRALLDLRDAQRGRAQAANTTLDPSTVESTISYLENGARWGRFEELQHCVYLNALRRQQRPVYGKNIVDLVSIDAYNRPCRPRPTLPHRLMAWMEGDLALMRNMTPTLDQRADDCKMTIQKFSCVTPPVVTRDLEEVLLGRQTMQAFTEEDLRLSAPTRWSPFIPKESPPDPWHETRMKHSIQFPDKRLLQFDCGKLQVLDKLLRKLQSGGHRALIFTQMTKVLDILEQFLNIHGHKYLRLDGATKVEQRQILTDRFNNDPRILCFILSTRSGGLGINLTGADTVIFYDQDWNPAMDKQCQDRCHRIGQTRDVHIYRLVSEHTIEANILRKASQKQMLDDVVIQEGEFTTDYFNRVSVRDVLQDKVDLSSEGVAAADAALDRVLGGPDTSQAQRSVGRALEQAEDREDVAAARVAEREIQADDEDFTEKPAPASGTPTTRQGTPAGKIDDGLETPPEPEDEGENNAWGGRMTTVDHYMIGAMTEELKYTKLELPKDKKKSKKKGRDTRKR